MARNMANVNILTEVFGDWLEKTNKLIFGYSTEVVTANSTVGVTGTTGDLKHAKIIGSLTANTIAVANLQGGDATGASANLQMTSNVNFNGTLINVSSNANFNSIVTFSSNVTMNNIQTRINANTLNLSSSTTTLITNTFSVAGRTFLTGNTQIFGTLVTGSTTINGTLQAGNTNIFGSLAVGNTTINGTLQAGNTNLFGFLNTGNTTVNGFANVAGTLQAGNTTLSLLTSGNTKITGTANIAGTLLTGNTTINGTLQSGAFSSTSSGSVDLSFDVGTALFVGDVATIAGNTTSNNIICKNKLTVNAYSLEVSSNVNIGTNAVPRIIYSFPHATYSTAKFKVVVKNSGIIQSSEMLLVHDGNTPYITVYGTIAAPPSSNSVSPLGNYTAQLNTTNIELFLNQALSNSEVKVIAELIR